MPQGDKSSYSPRQRRMARHIEESYEEKGLSEDEAERRAWATVNKGSSRGKSKVAAKRNRSASAKKAARTRKRTTAKKSSAKRSTARKSTAKKSTARKSTGRKSAAKKSTGRKSTRKRASR